MKITLKNTKVCAFTLRVCLDGKFKRGREGRVHFLFLNYGHYKMFFKKLTYLHDKRSLKASITLNLF